jgi:hypothetical protein
MLIILKAAGVITAEFLKGAISHMNRLLKVFHY